MVWSLFCCDDELHVMPQAQEHWRENTHTNTYMVMHRCLRANSLSINLHHALPSDGSIALFFLFQVESKNIPWQSLYPAILKCNREH